MIAAGDCTLREAVVIASPLASCTVPMLHTAAALMKIAQMDEYSGAQSIFLRTLIDKKYTLPSQVVDALVDYFVRFEHDDCQLPVLWHQSLLAFSQRYKLVLSDEQISAIMKLTKKHYHHQISEEVRRELNHAMRERTTKSNSAKQPSSMEVF